MISSKELLHFQPHLPLMIIGDAALVEPDGVAQS